MRRQFYELRPGQTLRIGDSFVTLEQKTGQRARLRVESDAPTALASTPAIQRPEPPRATPPAVPPLQRPPLPAG